MIFIYILAGLCGGILTGMAGLTAAMVVPPFSAVSAAGTAMMLFPIRELCLLQAWNGVKNNIDILIILCYNVLNAKKKRSSISNMPPRELSVGVRQWVTVCEVALER